MPYGIPKEIGGDSPSNVKWMEKCVNRVNGTKDKKGSTIGKDRAIAICKSTLRKSRGKASEADVLMSVQLSTLEWLDNEEN